MKNQPHFKWYVVNLNTISIDSGWRDLSDATAKMMAKGGGFKVMTKPRIGAVVLDPNDDASWMPKRNNPRRNPNTETAIPERGRRVHAHVASPATRGDVVWATNDEMVIDADGFESNLESRGHGIDWEYENPRANPARRRRPRQNPGELLILNPEADSARAEKVYEMWHQKEPHSISIRRPGVDMNDVMVCVGQAHNIVYRSGKWEQGRKTNDYVHHFDSKPKVFMLERVLGDEDLEECSSATKTVSDLVRSSLNADGQCAGADLATPISFGLDDGTSEGSDITIHSGARVYGAVDKKTVIIFDPTWKIIVIKGGRMTFDERGIVK